jgi:hypothetical protein
MNIDIRDRVGAWAAHGCWPVHGAWSPARQSVFGTAAAARWHAARPTPAGSELALIRMPTRLHAALA